MNSIPAGVQTVGLPWYEKDGFQQCRFIMKDGNGLPRTYEEWERQAEALEERLRSQGIMTIRAIIRPHDFINWCRLNGHGVDAKGRMAYANFVAMQAHRNIGEY